MTKYKQFLEAYGVISEDDFNKIIESLPEIDMSDVDFDDMDVYGSEDDSIARAIITGVIVKHHIQCAYCDEANFASKSFAVGDVDSLEELDCIKNLFPNWTISNYDEIKESIEEGIKEEEESIEFRNLITEITINANIEQLREFAKTVR